MLQFTRFLQFFLALYARPSMCYIFEKLSIQEHQKQCSHVFAITRKAKKATFSCNFGNTQKTTIFVANQQIRAIQKNWRHFLLLPNSCQHLPPCSLFDSTLNICHCSLYRVVCFTGPPLKVISFRLHSKSHRKSVRIS